MRHPHGITVTVNRQEYDPRTGDPIGDPVPHDIPGCAFDPGGTREVSNLGVTVTTVPTLYGPYDADIASDDEVVIPEHGTYQVAGDITRWQNPFTGDKPGSVVELTRTKGA